MKVIHVSGTRKRAVARATLKEGKGTIRINKLNLQIIQPEPFRLKIGEPLILAGDVAKKVDINITVQGGGITGQSEASRLVIAKALAQYQPALKKKFLEYDRHLLVADVRRNEPHKPNDSKPRRKRQFSKR